VLFLLTLFVGFSLAACQGVIIRAPQNKETPVVSAATYSLSNTLTGIRIQANFNKSGKAYYAVYNSDPGTLTAAQVVAASSAALAGSLVAQGVVDVTSANSNFLADINALPDKTKYFVVVASEIDGTVMDSVKKYDDVLPLSVSQQTYTTTVTGDVNSAAGLTVRHLVHYPQGYYDNPDRDYPLLVYIHGAGENNSTVGNLESNFLGVSGTGMYRIPLAARVNQGTDDVPFIQVSVQCNSYYFTCSWDPHYLLVTELITNSLAMYRADPKKVYLMGLSWGGVISHIVAWQRPDLIAAVVPKAGTWPGPGGSASDPTWVCNNGATQRLGAANVAMWTFIADNDGVYTDSVVQTTLTNTLKTCPGYTADARSTVISNSPYPYPYPNNIDGHGSTGALVANAPFYVIGASAFYYWNGSAHTSTGSTPLYNISHPQIILDDFSTAQTALRIQRGDPTITIDSIYDWMGLFSKP
jgi:predicted peptidase